MTAALRPLALLVMAVGMTVNRADPDLWGHVRFGLDLIRDRALHAADPYSYTSDRAWVNHEWLSELIAGGAYELGGAFGLIALKALIAIVLFWLVWGTVRDRAFAWRWSGMALSAFVALPVLLTVRPHLWTALGIVIVCRVLTSSSRGVLWVLPPLFAVWANLHGGWLVGGGLVALWTTVAVVRRDRHAWTLVAAGAASLAATLLTPYGLGMWAFLLETVRFGRSNISEWQPIWNLGLDSVALWLATLAFIAGSWRWAGRPSASVMVLLGGLAIAAARVDRLGPMFGLAVVALLARTWPKADERLPSFRGRAAIDGFAVAVGLVVIFAVQAPPTCIKVDPLKGPDTVAAESLRGGSGKLVTFFDWGEYAIWHFGPRLKVSMDGRRETVYPERTLTAQFGTAAGTAAGLAELASARPDYVWLPVTSRATADWLRANGYREEVRTRRSFVAVRADQAPLAVWDRAPSGCFPGP